MVEVGTEIYRTILLLLVVVEQQQQLQQKLGQKQFQKINSQLLMQKRNIMKSIKQGFQLFQTKQRLIIGEMKNRKKSIKEKKQL